MTSLPNDSVVQVHDLFDKLPEFMLRADTIFTDIPYNQSLLTNFSNRDEAALSPSNTLDFGDFTTRFFECIKHVNPKHLFVEVGKEALADYIIRCQDLFKYVTFYNSTYYNRIENKCYVIHATNTYKFRRYKPLEDLDEADVVKWLCHNHEFKVIGDLCMGEGLVGKCAYHAGKSFVGIDINGKRLQVLVDYIKNKEGVS
jgi:hypothetical protein